MKHATKFSSIRSSFECSKNIFFFSAFSLSDFQGAGHSCLRFASDFCSFGIKVRKNRNFVPLFFFFLSKNGHLFHFYGEKKSVFVFGLFFFVFFSLDSWENEPKVRKEQNSEETMSCSPIFTKNGIGPHNFIF